MKLAGKIAVITGAGSGIGRAMARTFAAQGASVVCVDRDEAVHAVAAEVSGTAVVADVSDPAQVAAMLDRDRIDILCNNAGVLDALTPVAEISDALWRKVMSVNLDGPFYASRAVIPRMITQGGGVILNTCSAAALSGGRAGAAYTASKHGLLGLTRSIAWFYGEQGIRCVAIAPGAIQTKMHTRDAPNEAGMARYAPYFSTLPAQGKASQVADVACFLVSDEASYVNGEVISVDGGWGAF